MEHSDHGLHYFPFCVYSMFFRIQNVTICFSFFLFFSALFLFFLFFFFFFFLVGEGVGVYTNICVSVNLDRIQ